VVNAHLWSDGCAGQFKNKDQFYWLTTGFQAYGIRLVHNFFQSCHGKGPSDSEGAVVKTGVRKHEFHRGTYVADTEAAFNLLSEHYTKVAHEPSPAEVARKERHTIASRTFHLVPDDRVDHARKTVVTPISGSSSRFCFDGLKGPSANDVSGSDATLVYSELSHYFTASQGHCQACFVGHPEGCTADPAVYSMDDTLVERNDASRSKSTTDRTKATKHRLDRARDLLRGGQNRGRGKAAAGDWVLIYLSDVEGVRAEAKGSALAAVRLVDGDVRTTGKMRRAHLLVHWPAVVTREMYYAEPNGDQHAVPLEKLVSPPFKMAVPPRAASAAASSSSSSAAAAAAAAAAASSPPRKARWHLPSGVLQTAKALVVHDKRLFPADALL